MSIYTCIECAPPAIVYLNTEVNARYPAAVDRHIRVVQWNHWTRDKCRFAQPASTCIMTMWPMSVSTACISADPFTHHICARLYTYTHRVAGGRSSAGSSPTATKSHSSEAIHTFEYVFARCHIALIHVTLHHMSEWDGWG